MRRHAPITALLIGLLVISGNTWAKSGPSLHTREEIVRVRERCTTEEWAVAQREQAEASAARWVAMSDGELWAFVLDADITRALNVNFGEGCPVHGKEVFQKGGHYPWIMTTDEPFKVKCPVGGETYPTNDYAAYLANGQRETLDTKQPYVDDGRGYVASDGSRYYFVAHYVFWQRWRGDIWTAMSALNQAYLLTGDAKYAHKLGVMLGRLTQVYPQMDYASQAYHNGQYPAKIDGRVLDYVWENSTIKLFARCYDGIYDAIPEDAALETFLKERGIQDLRTTFERKVLHFMVQDVMAGRIRGNMYYQPTLATLAIVIDNEDADYGPTTEQMVDWLLYGKGEIELILYNGFDRDGAGGESAPGYSSSWNNNFCQVAGLLAQLGYDVMANPRWERVIRFPYNLTLSQQYCPRIGDSGGDIHSAPPLINAPVLTFGYTHFRDPQCAQLLLNQDVFKESLWNSTLDREDVEAVAKSAPDCTHLGTRDLGGYGLAVFEAGEGESRRAATLYYGGPDAWHGHHDRLTVGYHAHNRDFLSEMGYPAHWNDKGYRFTRGMPCHYIVEIDEKCSNSKRSGYLDFFAAGKKTRVARAHGEAIYPGIAKKYQRTFAMIDSGDTSFLVDLFHVKGGVLHDYHFHGLPFGEFSTDGLALLAKQEKGTLLGEDIEWGGDTSKKSSGYDFLRNVRRYTAEDTWSVRWLGRDDCRLAYWMPAFPEVIVCDGEPPYKPDYPETMEFIVVRNPEEESRFPAIIAPSRAADVVHAVTFTQEDGENRYQVRTEEGVWEILVADSGRFEAVIQRADGTAYGFFANCPLIHFDGRTYDLKEDPVFTIEGVDYASNTVTLRDPIADPEKFVGEVCVVKPPEEGATHSASYTVIEAQERTLRFDGPAITGMFLVAETDGEDEGATMVKTATRLSGYGMQIAARAFPGMALINEDMSGAARIAKYRAARFSLATPLPVPDTNNDGRCAVYFADFAPGHQVVFTPWTEIERTSSGAIEIRGSLHHEQLRKSQ